MGKIRFSQLEMFSLEQNQSGIQPQPIFRLKDIKNYEKVILVILSFLLISVVSYCCGFKQGKKLALLNNNVKQMDTTETKIPTTNIPVNLESEREKSLPKEERTYKSGYTIQVATYKTSDYAQREAGRLKKRGFNTLIINKGNYTLLCVGSFFNKQEAEILLAKLKKDYGDCFIRRF